MPRLALPSLLHPYWSLQDVCRVRLGNGKHAEANESELCWRWLLSQSRGPGAAAAVEAILCL